MTQPLRIIGDPSAFVTAYPGLANPGGVALAAVDRDDLPPRARREGEDSGAQSLRRRVVRALRMAREAGQ